jgi:hypothetical protein
MPPTSPPTFNPDTIPRDPILDGAHHKAPCSKPAIDNPNIEVGGILCQRPPHLLIGRPHLAPYHRQPAIPEKTQCRQILPDCRTGQTSSSSIITHDPGSYEFSVLHLRDMDRRPSMRWNDRPSATTSGSVRGDHLPCADPDTAASSARNLSREPFHLTQSSRKRRPLRER